MKIALIVLSAALLATAVSAGPAQRRERIVLSSGGDLYLVDPDGRARTRLTRTVSRETSPRLSPDGKRIAFVGDADGNAEIYVMDTAATDVRQLTTNARVPDTGPAWSPDGRRLAYASGPAGQGEIHVMSADGTGKRKLVADPADDVEPAWSPDGTQIAFASNRLGSYDVWTAEVAGGAPSQLTDDPAAEREPAWSPEGARLTLVSDRDGNGEIYAIDRTAPELARLTDDPAADGSPAWSPDGRRIAFSRAEAIHVMGADGSAPIRVTAGTEPDWGRVHVEPKPRPPPPPPPSPPPQPPPRASEVLPELDQRAPSGLTVTQSRGRFLLGFVSATDNVGEGPIWIRGRRPLPSGPMTASQLIRMRDGTVREVRRVGVVRYTWSSSHSHWHLLGFQRFELRRASDFSLVVRDRKTGFCLADHYGLARRRVRSFTGAHFLGDCGKGRPDLLTVTQGSSPGFTDRYPAHFHGQNVDVTAVRAGLYVLVHRANPSGRLRERTLSNNAASVRIRLAWPHGRKQPPRVAVLRVCEGRERC